MFGLVGFGDEADCGCGDVGFEGGRGQELERALTLNEIENELWTWVS